MGFYKDLEFSKDARFNELYKKQFMRIENIEEVEDMELQRKGIDKILTLRNGKRVTVEEKVRRKHYGDIVLELYSNVELVKWGWLYTIQAEFLAYLTPKQVYLLPTEQLKTAWHYNQRDWLERYGTKRSNTEGKYQTEWIAIPDHVLIKAIQETMVLSV